MLVIIFNDILYARHMLKTIILLLLMSSLAGCNWQTNVESGLATQTLHLGNGAEPKDLDPHTVTGVSEGRLIRALLETLVVEHPATLAPLPGAAASWDISPDYRQYTFRLREDGRWSNGDRVTAHDFVYAWRRMLTPALAAEYAYQFYAIANAQAFHAGELTDFTQVGIRALNDETLQVDLTYPVPYFLHLVAHTSFAPVHPPTIERFGGPLKRHSLWTRPENYVGNGAFRLSEWTLNRWIKMQKNPLYWNADQVTLNEVVFYPIENITTEERMFRSGTLHKTETVHPDSIARFQGTKTLRIAPYLGTYYFKLNTQRPPLDDVRVRRALSLALDRQALVQFVTKGGEIASNGFVPVNLPGYATPAEPDVQARLERAQALLAEAGYPQGKGLPTLELLYNTAESHRRIAVAIQAMWQQLGINVELVNQDWKVYLSSVKQGNYHIARAGWIGDYPDPNTFLDIFSGNSGNNNTGWQNMQYDALLLQAAQASSDQRYALLQQAEAILLEAMPIIPIYTYTSKALVSTDIQGWYDNIFDHHPLTQVLLAPATGQAR